MARAQATTFNMEEESSSSEEDNSSPSSMSPTSPTSPKSGSKFTLRLKVSSGSNLQRMMMRERDLYCDKCEFKTASPYTLRLHHKTHRRPTSHRCTHCRLEVATTEELRKHFREAHSKSTDDMNRCVKCGFKATSQRHLGNHMRNIHVRTYKCTVDDCTFATFAKLRMAMHSERNHGGYKCTYCTYFIMDKLDSFEHMIAEHMDKSVSASDLQHMESLAQRRNGHAKVFKCGISNCIFGTPVKLSLVLHRDKNHYGYKCPHPNCTYFTSDKNDSVRHKLAVHTKKVSPELMESLVEQTKNVRVTDDAQSHQSHQSHKSHKYDEAKYDVAKARLRYDEAKVKMSKLRYREAKGQQRLSRMKSRRSEDDGKRQKARRRLDMDRVDGISSWLAGQEPVVYKDSLADDELEQEALDLSLDEKGEMELCEKLEDTRML